MLLCEWEVNYEDYLWELEQENSGAVPMTLEEYVKFWQEV